MRLSDGVNRGIYGIDAKRESGFAGGMHTVAIPLYPGFQPLDVAGPHEVFVGANHAMDELGSNGERYEVILPALTLEPVRSESGLTFGPTHTFTDTSIDTLLVPGGMTTRSSDDHVELVKWLQANAPTERGRVGSVCTGTFLLAASGLVTTQRVTTHWAYAGLLATEYPELDVDPDPIYRVDGNVWTSAGVTAGIDLALAMVEADCGASVAKLVARHLVVYLHRPGGQSQFSSAVWSEATEIQPIRDACDVIHQSPEIDLSVAALAESVGMSERNFTRVFRSEIGESPARYVDRVRVEAARTILERENTSLDQVASRTGFSSAEVLRRAFHRRLGISPAAYRRTSKPTRISN